ncbi:hypothetical protein SAMN05720473_101452 [Fibrobacter sp. UWB15]|jgi:hypothetical protein|nr:hypothetical protein BGW99_101452 [Fibrobacter sp. UWB6]SHF71566.1 hypothetical protein SAMN05720760_101417 [Fibrobacter sp. UWB8]SMG12557.1 hypothetical protein SAMN05720473_101452 [Fibrobacter sp. UWB15]
MTYFKKLLAFSIIFFTCNVASFADGFNENANFGFRYGPNLSWTIMGNTPFVWGQWLPQATGMLHYTWLEPLDELAYGEKLESLPSYLRMDAAIEVSPFYAGYLAGIGIRPFKTNPQIEANVVYESYLYMRSNLEMVTAEVEGEGRIAESWNADYVVDNIYKDDAAFDYTQLIDMSFCLNYALPKGSNLGLKFHYILLDVSTDFDGKSYDYRRNIPVFSRDFLLVLDTYGRIPLTKHFAAIFESNFYKTGFLRDRNTVRKESLGYGRAMLGAHFFWSEERQNIILEVGGWKRTEKRFYDGSFAQQFLVQLEYQGYFSFPFHRNFSK